MAKGTSRDATPEQGTSFGTRLRRLREAASLTQEELASRSGLSATAVSVLERGERRRPYPHTVRSLADALGLSEDERATLVAAVPGRGRTAATVVGAATVHEATLPSAPTPLLGREQELREIRELLLNGSEVRLLTLTGIGGVGKTRLALEAAREAEGHFPDRVAFVALAPLRDPALVVSTIARSQGLREAEGQSAGDALRAHLREKRTLLVLDNFEHLLGAAAEVVHLIEACPGLVVLATSRAPLRIRSEQEYPVPPLALPSATHNPTEEEVLTTPSGRLFVERTRAASPSFEVTTENAAAVAAICWRLAGLPLALELAAVRVRFLSPSALLARLDRALSTGWVRDLPDRQRTMRATLDWSYDLLSEPEKALFRRLSVFSGGFSLEAAEVVGDDDDVVDLLGRLVEQSVVEMELEARGREARYGMLEPVRQYALEKLGEHDEAADIQRRHTALFLELAEQARPELRGPDQMGWLQRLEQENSNLRAALGWALANEVETAARLGWALWAFWRIRGHQQEGRRWMEATLAYELPAVLRARAALAAAVMAYAQGDYGACEAYSAEALELSRRVGDELCTAHSCVGLGLEAMERGDLKTARSYFEAALPLFDRVDEEGMVPAVRAFLGTVALVQGDHVRAVLMFEEALTKARRIGDRGPAFAALYNLAQVALVREDHRPATRMLEEGVALSEEMGDLANLSYFLEGLAVVAGTRGEVERSAHMFGAAERLMKEAGAPVYSYYIPDRSLYERTKAAVRSRLGEPAFEEAWGEGSAMSFDQAIEYALERNEAQPHKR